MNERIREFAEQAGFNHMGIWNTIGIWEYHEKFAKLIVRDVTNLLRQEWFNENNDKEETDKREIAIRLGKKLAYMKSVDLITERYGVEL